MKYWFELMSYRWIYITYFSIKVHKEVSKIKIFNLIVFIGCYSFIKEIYKLEKKIDMFYIGKYPLMRVKKNYIYSKA